MHSWKHVFDASEAAIGQFANSLKLGCDCLGEIRYFDATLLGWNGEPVTIENAICMHEEDFGILWKHTDLLRRHVEVRRSRRLVVVDDAHGRQLRVRLLLVPLPRRHDPDGESS